MFSHKKDIFSMHKKNQSLTTTTNAIFHAYTIKFETQYYYLSIRKTILHFILLFH